MPETRRAANSLRAATVSERPACRARGLHNVTAAILAGGLGTRLRPAPRGMPKVLADVNGRPFITYLLDRLVSAGISRVVLLTGHLAGQVSDALGEQYRRLKLCYSIETTPLGTAGALRRALPKLHGDTVLLLNGDSMCDVNLPRMVEAHRRRGAGLTMALVRVADTTRFGRVKMAADGRLVHFEEKQASTGPGWINAGIYVIKRSLILTIPAKQTLSLERDVLPGWLESARCHGFKAKGRFLDIGTPCSFAAATFYLQ